MISMPGSLSFAKLMIISSAPANSVGGARCASQDPFFQSTLSHTISTPVCIRSALFLHRTCYMFFINVVLFFVFLLFQQKNVPFSDFFQVEPLQSYHRVILAEDFMKHLAPTHWPKGTRRGYCWLPPGSNSKCVMKVGFNDDDDDDDDDDDGDDDDNGGVGVDDDVMTTMTMVVVVELMMMTMVVVELMMTMMMTFMMVVVELMMMMMMMTMTMGVVELMMMMTMTMTMTMVVVELMMMMMMMMMTMVVVELMMTMIMMTMTVVVVELMMMIDDDKDNDE